MGEIKKEKPPVKGSNIFGILKPYTKIVAGLIVLTIAASALNLVIPKIIANGIDAYTSGTLVMQTIVFQFALVSLIILILAYGQALVQTYASERVARDLRDELAEKISRQTFSTLQAQTPSKLLTNLTSDMDQVKQFVSNAVVSIISSVFLIVGTSILLFIIDWKLALAVLAILPFIAISFFAVFSRMRPLFKKTQEIIDRLNKVINESILGASLIRVLNSQQQEYEKFIRTNTDAKTTGLQVLGLFASIIPVITLISNLATLIILGLGGHFVIAGSMSLGNFTAFNAYLAILIFPLIIIGFMSNVIARAQASYTRVREVLDAPDQAEGGKINTKITGNIDVKNVSLLYGEKYALKNISFSVKAGTKTAIIGPTAAGKTQLLQLLIGLLAPTSGSISYDGTPIENYDKAALHSQIGIVFQDSIMFNMSVRENIAFSPTVKDEYLKKAIDTAELRDFVDTLPQGLETSVSERGTSLSGGQKQRIMLARALALNPSVLLLDDFTARVDTSTEQKILKNLAENYPDLTLISVTQKIASVEDFDEIVLLMEGEILARGTHKELIASSPEYMQIFNSQRSTSAYELHA